MTTTTLKCKVRKVVEVAVPQAHSAPHHHFPKGVWGVVRVTSRLEFKVGVVRVQVPSGGGKADFPENDPIADMAFPWHLQLSIKQALGAAV